MYVLLKVQCFIESIQTKTSSNKRFTMDDSVVIRDVSCELSKQGSVATEEIDYDVY